MIAWARSTASAECLLRKSQPAAVMALLRRPISQGTRLVHNTTPTCLRGIQSLHALSQCSRYGLGGRGQGGVLRAATRHSKTPSCAVFSTCSIRLSEEVSNPKDDSSTLKKKRLPSYIRKMVGKPCPGCGSSFQVTYPNKPGFLAVNFKDFDSPKSTATTTTTTPAEEESNDLPLDSDANSMTNAQYETYLTALDPFILKEMGIITGGSNIDSHRATSEPTDNFTTKTTKASSFKSNNEAQEDLVDQDNNNPGMILPESTRRVCYRCHSLQHHNTPNARLSQSSSSSSSSSEVIFPTPQGPEILDMQSLVQFSNRILIIVMDLVDFPLSLPHLVVDELLRAVKSKRRPGTGVYNLHLPTPILIVGNKFDLMPAGTQKEDTRQRIEDYLIKHKLSRNVQGIHLVSAKHPSGDEILQLINHIVRLWPRACKGSVVIVGAENVGKSQLLNSILLESARLGYHRQQLREQKDDREKQTRQKKLNILLGSKSAFSDTKGSETEEIDLTIPALQKDRGVKKYNEFNVTVSNMPGTTLGRVKVPLSVLSRFMKADYKEVGKKWIVDTPGIRNSQGQISDWLTLEELKVSLPTKKLKPMSFTLEEGKSFFLGGLVRIDCISIESDASGTMGHHQRGSNPQPKITVFSSLPLHKTSMVNADKFMKQTMLGQLTVLQPPFGSPERLSVFPGLAHAFDRDLVIVNDPLYTASSQNLRTTAYTTAYMDPFVKLDARKDDNPRRNPIPSFNPRKKQEADLQLNGRLGICDLVFSGIGWVMISGKFQGPDQPVTLRVWTPKGQGAIVRDVCLLPEWATNPIEKTAGGIRQKQKIFQELPSESSSSELLMDI